MQGMIRGNEEFLAMQDRNVVAISIIPGFHPKRLEMHCERECQRRMWVALEFRIAQIGDLWARHDEA
jgi:hypothetical protein